MHGCCNFGDRVPAVFFHPKSTRLHIRTGTDTSPNDGCDPSTPLSMNGRFRTVTIRVIEDGTITVFFDGDRKVCERKMPGNTFPGGYWLSVYAGEWWTVAAHAEIKNLVYGPA
mmetsp:Transcript_11715/g.23584  ORF Transcript_11715/g.23584 Transcript_11715/m.23584 type:complete len:113 (+) Transcript_11715:324-662(+)